MSENNFIEKVVMNEVSGKYAAIHAYDGMIWKVRVGFLTVVFAGWSLVVKTAIEKHADFAVIAPFIFILSGFSIALALGGYMIDRNYAKRKFRVIVALNELFQFITTVNFGNMASETSSRLLDLLKISGDAANNKYASKAYSNEIFVSKIVYIVPSVLVIFITIYCRTKQ